MRLAQSAFNPVMISFCISRVISARITIKVSEAAAAELRIVTVVVVTVEIMVFLQVMPDILAERDRNQL